MFLQLESAHNADNLCPFSPSNGTTVPCFPLQLGVGEWCAWYVFFGVILWQH